MALAHLSEPRQKKLSWSADAVRAVGFLIVPRLSRALNQLGSDAGFRQCPILAWDRATVAASESLTF